VKDEKELEEIVRRLRLLVFDFDGVFTDNRVLVLQDGTEAVMCSRADGLGLDRLRKSGLDMLVLSKEQNPVVAARCNKLRLPYIQGCDEKAKRLKQEFNDRGITRHEVAYVGNDINDLECMELVDLPMSVSDGYTEVKRIASWVGTVPGGQGAVREICDWMADILERN
jgi:YrbI family 3-deoxy-D-manno-octulosonate 8-phosphate phosphatase